MNLRPVVLERTDLAWRFSWLRDESSSCVCCETELSFTELVFSLESLLKKKNGFPESRTRSDTEKGPAHKRAESLFGDCFRHPMSAPQLHLSTNLQLTEIQNYNRTVVLQRKDVENDNKLLFYHPKVVDLSSNDCRERRPRIDLQPESEVEQQPRCPFTGKTSAGYCFSSPPCVRLAPPVQ